MNKDEYNQEAASKLINRIQRRNKRSLGIQRSSGERDSMSLPLKILFFRIRLCFTFADYLRRIREKRFRSP